MKASRDTRVRDYGYTADRDNDYGADNPERMGADGSRVFVCSVCSRVEIAGYDGWVYHLGMREHQENLKKARMAMMWRNKEMTRRRCLVIRGIEGKKSFEVLEYLKIRGEIEDFQYDFIKAENGRTRHCIVLYREEDSAKACLAENGSEWEGRKLDIMVQTRQRRIIREDSGERKRKRNERTEDNIYSGR